MPARSPAAAISAGTWAIDHRETVLAASIDSGASSLAWSCQHPRGPLWPWNGRPSAPSEKSSVLNFTPRSQENLGLQSKS